MLDLDPDGGWCPNCEEYFPPDIIMQYIEENDPEAFYSSFQTLKEEKDGW